MSILVKDHGQWCFTKVRIFVLQGFTLDTHPGNLQNSKASGNPNHQWTFLGQNQESRYQRCLKYIWQPTYNHHIQQSIVFCCSEGAHSVWQACATFRNITAIHIKAAILLGLASNTPSATKHPDGITTNTGCSAAPGTIKQWPEEIMQLQLKESRLLRPSEGESAVQ